MMTRFSARSGLLFALLSLSTFACSSSSSKSGNSGNQTPPDTTPTQVNYDDPNIVYTGRIQFDSAKPPRFSSPGVTITARFKGVSAAMRVIDNSATSNYFDAVIDGDYANSVKIQPADSGDTELFSGLDYGEHTVTVVKRTESSTGQVDFKGFTFGGQILPPPDMPTRKIEIIGDSISVGSGDEAVNGSTDCNVDFGRPFSNANKSYGPLLARALNAQYVITAVSGIGALRNYNCSDPNTMPMVYDRLFLEVANSPVWDHTQYVPDALVILIGTNDFSPDSCNVPALNETVDPTNYQAFITKLEDFVTKLRGYYANADVFLLASPMLHDGWPDATYTSDTSQRAAISTVADDLNATDVGAGKIHAVLADYSATRISGRGCGTHPNDYEHGIMAGLDSTKPDDTVPPNLMLNPIKTTMGW